MKQLLLLNIFLFSAYRMTAQKNRISITITEYSKFQGKLIENDTTNRYSNKGIKILPSIGYYRMLKSNLGWGCEVGYKNQHTKLIDTFTNAVSERYIHLSTSKIREVYFCPTIFQFYHWNKFQLHTSIIIPISYQIMNKETQNQLAIYLPTNTEISDKYSTISNPKELNLGLYCNIGLFRKLTHNLYVGPQLGFGITQQIKYGHSSENIIIHENGITTEFNNIIQYKNYSNRRFDIRPTFSIFYNL